MYMSEESIFFLLLDQSVGRPPLKSRGTVQKSALDATQQEALFRIQLAGAQLTPHAGGKEKSPEPQITQTYKGKNLRQGGGAGVRDFPGCNSPD